MGNNQHKTYNGCSSECKITSGDRIKLQCKNIENGCLQFNTLCENCKSNPAIIITAVIKTTSNWDYVDSKIKENYNRNKTLMLIKIAANNGIDTIYHDAKKEYTAVNRRLFIEMNKNIDATTTAILCDIFLKNRDINVYDFMTAAYYEKC